MNIIDNNQLSLINRTQPVFEKDYKGHLPELSKKIQQSRIVVVGGAGSIGSTVVRILFDLQPKALHVVDINENGLADLVRSIRSESGYKTDDFLTICFDPLQTNGSSLIDEHGPYDVIFNFAAVKHVRSEKDPFTLSRMFDVNVRLMKLLTQWAETTRSHTLFSVSTDKAANPANLMGASKRLMEMTGFMYAQECFSTARFANVAFSNGSLLNAFWDRLNQGHPLSAPSNIRRFFITHEEAARLCILGAFVAPHGTISIPRAPGEIELTSFVDVATNVLKSRGYEPLFCESEEEARVTKPANGKWPCYFFESDTSGEKPFEEFIGDGEGLVETPFEEISLIGKLIRPGYSALDSVVQIDPLNMTKEEVVNRVADIVPGFSHVETGRNLDQRM